MRSSILVSFILFFVAACGDDGDPQGSSPLTLADGTRVEVGSQGGVALFSGDRPLLATADSAAPTLRRFTETYQPFGGLWVFTRADESSVALAATGEARQIGDAVEVRYASGDQTATATLTVRTQQPGESTLMRLEVETEDPAASVALPVRCDPDGGFYGFGEQYNQTDQRGEAFSLFVSEQGIGRDPSRPVLFTNGDLHTTYFPMPYYLDPRGFGVLIRTSRRVNVDLCSSDPGIAWLELIANQPLEILVFHGPTALDVIRQLGDEVGRPQPPPLWAYGLWIGSQGGREKVEEEAAALRAMDVPARVLWVQDWTGLRRNFSGGFGVQYRWTADEEYYPDLAGMIEGLNQDGFRFLAYVNPFVDLRLGHYPEMAEQGLLIMNEDGGPFVHLAPSGESSHPDLTKPAARDYVKNFLRAMVVDLGIDGWMADFGEWVPLEAVYADGSDGVEMHNRYPVEWHRLSREVMDEVRPDGDWVVFARSGWTGVQAVSQIHWVGDQETSFSPHDGLPTVVPAMLNLGLSGVPFVTHDIAGFSSLTVPPRDKELFLRWTELGAFTPIMRTHQGDRKQQNWNWNSDEETVAHFRRFARIHEALAGDFQALAAEAALTSAPILRHLMLVFPEDAPSREISDQFMIGDSLLVAPVVEEGASTRQLYLPPGTWYDVWSGEAHAGGREVEVNAPIGRPPVFSFGSDRADLRAIS